MGREVRRVPAGWEHPKDSGGNYVALYSGEDYERDKQEFLRVLVQKGLQEAIDWCGCPDKENYMPSWPEEEKTHYMMYENTSEGTPISPAFGAPEELARWLADTGASAFGRETASYEAWLRVCHGGYAPSCVFISGQGIISGVEALEGEER